MITVLSGMTDDLREFNAPQNMTPEELGDTLARLAAAGLCRQTGDGWHIRGALLACFVGSVKGQGDDEVRLDEETGEVFRGQMPLTGLAPLERAALLFMIKHPHVRHSKTDLILNAWPDDPRPLERTDDSVYQVIRGLRCKVEPNPSRPRYIVTWRGTGTQTRPWRIHPPFLPQCLDPEPCRSPRRRRPGDARGAIVSGRDHGRASAVAIAAWRRPRQGEGPHQ